MTSRRWPMAHLILLEPRLIVPGAASVCGPLESARGTPRLITAFFSCCVWTGTTESSASQARLFVYISCRDFANAQGVNV